jgi:hypothetical protein
MAEQLKALSARIDDLRNNLQVVTINYCTGEYTPNDCGGPRYDPRDWNADKIAQRECGARFTKFTYALVTNRSHSGGCCGYGYYTLTCTGYK